MNSLPWSIESYSLRADGDIDNWFTCRNKSFQAPQFSKVPQQSLSAAGP